MDPVAPTIITLPFVRSSAPIHFTAIFADSNVAAVRPRRCAPRPPRYAGYERRPSLGAIDAACAGLLAFVSYGFLDLMLLSLRFEMNSPTLLQVPLALPQVLRGPPRASRPSSAPRVAAAASEGAAPRLV